MRQAEPTIDCLEEGGPGYSLRETQATACWASVTGGAGSGGCCRAGLVPRQLLRGDGTCSLAQVPGSLPGLPDRTPHSVLTAEELKYADTHNIGAMIAPLHFLEGNLGKRPQPVKSELEEEEERRRGLLEKNKVVAAYCRSGKKERKECPQRESEWLELMSAELKTQMAELKQERQQLILMLNGCIVRTCIARTIKTPDSEGNPLLEQLEKK
ncbi:jun dimerization protein 2-like [Pipistrellus kuhlii]|uniref:jun dimerization protein 2-like n=1 Tax=Pipistrellus kuhlii TaxID=59472 RepID=UPI00174F4E7E|nr:jun dimerization protein 2-like [Pipistrellus kuhlii]